MSDGPHKSLNMRRGWKRLSERADKKAYAPDEVREALPRALVEDWHAEIPLILCRQIRTILDDPQTSFFSDQKVEALEALRSGTVIQPLGSVFLECVIHVVTKGLAGEVALSVAVLDTLCDRATRGARQVEEHYLRESTPSRAVDVRRRIEEGIASSDFSTIAAQLIGADKTEQPLGPAKQTGLDDGVRLS